MTNEIKILKPLYLETAISPNSTVIVAPHDECRPLAEKFAEDLQARHGIELPIWSDHDTEKPGVAAKNRIALGNLANNQLIERLYCRSYTNVDIRYPGTGGYVVQTVHNPDGTGSNIIVLGGSNKHGVEEAAKCFLDHVEKRDGRCSVPRILDVKLGNEFAGFVPDEPSISGKAPSPFEAAHHYGQMAIALGSKDYEKRFRDAIVEAARTQSYNHFALMWGVPYFDVLEESPVFTDEQRLAVTNYFLGLLLSSEGVNYCWFRRGLKGPSLRHNHQTHAALGIHYAAQYLIKYYGFEPAKTWLREARELFSTFLDGYERPPCDDSRMQLVTLREVFWYLLDVFGPEACQCAMVRKSVERMILWTDSNGMMPPVGDGTPGNNAADIFRWGEYLLRDGRCRFLLNRLAEESPKPEKASPIPRLYASTPVQPQEPEGAGKAVLTPMDKIFYATFAAETSPKKPNVPFEKTFDKITFRGGWSRDDDYLLFDGISYGGHDYDDGNTVLQFSALDCVFITSLDFISPRVTDHNAITITRNGTGAVYPPFPELLWLHNTEWGAASRTCLRNYAGIDWHRTLIWVRNQFTVVVDELVALETAEYLFRRHWRLTGAARCSGKRVVTTQERLGKEKLFVLETSYAGDIDVFSHPLENLLRSNDPPEEPDGRAGRSKAYWANAPLHVWVARETVRREMRKGESVFLATLFYPVRKNQELAISEIEHGVYALVRDSVEAVVLCRSANAGVQFEGEDIQCDAALITRTAATILDAHKSETRSPIDLPTLSVKRIPTAIDHGYAPSRNARILKCITLDSSVTAMCAGKDKHSAACIGYADGTVMAVDSDWALLRQHHVEGQVNHLCLLDHPREGCCVLASAGDYLRCVTPAGREIWNYTTPYEKKQYSVWRFESSLALTTLTQDVNQDGIPEIIHATGSAYLALLTADGREIWSQNVIFPRTTLAVGDYRGDGTLCVMAGAGHMSPWADAKVYDCADGKSVVEGYVGVYVDPWVARLDSLWAGDLDDDGKCEMVAGTEVGTLALYRPSESKKEHFDMVPWDAGTDGIQPVWRITLGDCVTSLAVVDTPQGKQIIAGSTNEHVVCVGLDGIPRWHCDAGDGVVCVVPGRDTFCVGTDDGRAVILDFTGKRLSETRVASIQRSDPKRFCNPRVRAVALPGNRFLVTCANNAKLIAP